MTSAQAFDRETSLDLPPEEVGVFVYREVWDEFSAWEQEECARIILSLASSPTQDENTIRTLSHAPISDLLDRRLNESGESFQVFEYEDDSSLPKAEYELRAIEVPVQSMKPWPTYGFCTPSSRNLWKDTPHAYNIPFCPFADDPRFDVEDYLATFDSFDWQIDFMDPDGVCKL